MERQVPLADYARNIDLHPDILRQALTGRLQGTDSHPVNALAKAINRDPEQVDLTTVPFEEAFSVWLKRNMEGITQHGLRARTQLDSRTLKRFLNGDLLPDSDQAERISRALYIDRIEVARVITANMAAASSSMASPESPEPRAMSRQSNVSTELGTSTPAGQLVTSTRRRRTSPRRATAEQASLLSAVAPTTIDETASAPIAPDMTATADAPKAGKRPKRASKPEAQPPAPVVAAMTTHRPHDEVSSLAAVEAQEADRDSGAVRAAVDQTELLTSPVPAKTVTEKEVGTRRPKRSTTRGVANVVAVDQMPALAAEIAPAQPNERRADISMDRTAPLVPAELATDTTTLQLSADEVRLIRHWRQLHPHGRRATLQYIGSLLVDD
jgi:hypothetical protein